MQTIPWKFHGNPFIGLGGVVDKAGCQLPSQDLQKSMTTMDNGISDYRKVNPRIKMNYDWLNFLIIKNSRWPILHITDIICKTHASVTFF